MSHQCHAFKCSREVPPKMFMCFKHWKMLPRVFQNDIWKNYRPGQEVDKRPSSEYLKAAQRAVCMIVVAESGVPLERAIEIFKQHSTKGESVKVAEVRYARKFNNGNYESEEFGITMIVEEDETASKAFKQCQKEVNTARSLESGDGKTEGEEEDEEVENKTGKNRRGRKPKDDEGEGSGDDNNEIEGEDESEEETEGEGSEEEVAGNEDESEEENDDGKKSGKQSKKSQRSTDGNKAGKVTGKSGKSFKKKPQVYDRANEAHKEIFSAALRDINANWSKDKKLKAKGVKASADLDGDDFLDAEGDVLPAFLTALKKAMAKK